MQKADKNLPNVDSLAEVCFFLYDIDTTKKHLKEEFVMRHVYIRSILAFIWLAAAIVSVNMLFAVMAAVFMYSAYAVWKKEKKDKGEE